MKVDAPAQPWAQPQAQPPTQTHAQASDAMAPLLDDPTGPSLEV